jgi:hypothetical protein
MDGRYDARGGVGQQDGYAVGDEHPDTQAGGPGDERVTLSHDHVRGGGESRDDPDAGAVHLVSEGHRRAQPTGHGVPVRAHAPRIVADLEPEVELGGS